MKETTFHCSSCGREMVRLEDKDRPLYTCPNCKGIKGIDELMCPICMAEKTRLLINTERITFISVCVNCLDYADIKFCKYMDKWGQGYCDKKGCVCSGISLPVGNRMYRNCNDFNGVPSLLTVFRYKGEIIQDTKELKDKIIKYLNNGFHFDEKVRISFIDYTDTEMDFRNIEIKL